MGTPALFYPHAIILPDTAEITQFDELEPANNYADLTEYSASDVLPSFTGSHSATPVLPLRTTQIKTVLDQIDVDGVAADLSAGNTDVFYRKGLNRGSRVAGATTAHLRCRMASNAFLSWESISARDGALAEISARILPVWDGTNAPMQWAASQALDGDSAVSALFTLGPIKLQGSFLDGVSSADWANNLEYEEIKGDGKGFVAYAAVRRARPVLSFTTTDRAVMATYGASGTALSALSFFLRKKSASGINVADATEEHIKLTASAGTIKADSAAGRVMVEVHSFTISTASAIS